MYPKGIITLDVSIHAPNEGSDLVNPVRVTLLRNVSIHAPNEGSDLTDDNVNLLV